MQRTNGAAPNSLSDTFTMLLNMFMRSEPVQSTGNRKEGGDDDNKK